ncbi:MAG: PHP domain-containing protein [Clostridia bacterium]
MKRIDLHIHTNKSDGILMPTEVIDEAVKNGVDTIAIADHDTVEAYSNSLFEYAKAKNVKLIKAVEISTKTDKAGIHVLGYNIDINNEKLKQKLYELRNARHIYLHDVAERLGEIEYKVNVKELDKVDAVTKAHIALDVVRNPENKDLLIKEFGHIPEKGEFIETIMNEGCPAYVKKSTITPKEAAELIRMAGGKAVLAHPVAYEHEDNLDENEILDIVKDMKADGIETNYIYINRNNEIINEIQKWNEFAQKYNLPVTIGSDFHSKDGIRPEIGLANQDVEFNEEYLEKIVEWIEK